MRFLVRLGPLWLVTLTVAPGSARAWSNHTLITWVALGGEPLLQQAAPVPAETLDDFLAENESGIGSTLDEVEAWARREVPSYPPRPEALRFERGRGERPARQRFLEAMRANPTLALPLFVQVVPGAARHPGRAAIAEADLLPRGVSGPLPRQFEALRPGELVAPLEVVSTASDEPDYGLDIGLFDDNGTPHGARFGWGAQSVGNPRLAYGSQAPFHMGFFHEPGVVYRFAGFLRRMFPEHRIGLCVALSRYAFRTGHDYWGWRFLGWALHYVEDLGQPYHASLLPGTSAAAAIWNNLIAMVGFGGAKARMITLVSNRHLVLEDLQLRLLVEGFSRGERVVALVPALADRSADALLPRFDTRAPRAAITAWARAQGERVDEALLALLPARLVDDASYTYSVSEPAVDTLAAVRARADAEERIEQLLADLLRQTGAWARLTVRAVRGA